MNRLASTESVAEQIFPELLSYIDGLAQHPEWRYTLSSPVDHSFDEYSEAFGFDIARLAGGVVLDVGAGVHGRFAHEAPERGVRVIPLNPAWKDTHYYRTLQGVGSPYGPEDPLPPSSVIGQAEHLPFLGNSFDFVFSLWGVPGYLPGTAEAHTRAYREIRRVLKIGGVALLYPVMAVVAKDPRYHEVLEMATEGDYKLLTRGIPPKLLVHKQADITNAASLDEILASSDRQTPGYIW